VVVAGLGLVGFFAIVLARTHDRLRAQAEQAAYDARHDPLTGLASRSNFGAELRAAIAASRDGAPLVVMMLDLDRFKEINDTFGHGTGDTLLRAVGARLERLRGPGDVLARLGGDEFALLVRGADAAVGQEVSTRVLELVSQPIALADVVVSVEASIGIVQYPEHGTDAETLLQRADVAMYLAKDRGRGKALYNPADDHHTAHRLSLAGELRRAIADDELELHYQPKLELRGLRLAGVEALVRWRHPRHGLIPPGEFIPLAEHTAAIRPLTLLVLRKALRQQRAWGAEGLETSVAVNLSVANLLDTQLVADLALILDEEGVAGDRLVLELTESMVMVDPERSIALLGRLAAMGIEIAVDDFGTGHASLAYLRRLPIAELKIDRVFVRDIATDAQDAAIVAATVALAHTLGLRVVAEGVEDAEALARLRVLGCDSAQGYHLYRPMPSDELRDALHAAARDERRAA
jgi:diguanylate cyclase (GGDEF)-like protein